MLITTTLFQFSAVSDFCYINAKLLQILWEYMMQRLSIKSFSFEIIVLDFRTLPRVKQEHFDHKIIVFLLYKNYRCYEQDFNTECK